MAGVNPRYLVETALLTHGLTSLSPHVLTSAWGESRAHLAWLDQGEIIIGPLSDYLQFRPRHKELIRVDKDKLGHAMAQKQSGALTASGTMAVCAGLGITVAVTVGMGGIGELKGEELCPDLPALAELPVALIATAPKDMMDYEQTISWLLGHGVTILGRKQPYCDGFLFQRQPLPITGLYARQPLQGQMLLLNPLPERLSDSAILNKAIAAGQAAEQAGAYYHPAANGEIDRLSGGLSSMWQLNALMDNILWAKNILNVD